MLLILLALPALCGAVPALPNSAFAQRQQRRIMAAEDLPEDFLLKGPEPVGPYAIQPSEQKAFVLKGRRVKNPSPAAIGLLLPPADSVAPKLSGWVAPFPAETAKQRERQQKDEAGGANGDAVINPAAFYLQGADLDKITPPTCHLIGCTGPLANDGDIALEGRTGPNADGTRQCHQTFVPLNGCWATAGGGGGDAYPVGMVCTICCECSAQLTGEMRRSRGWTSGYRAGGQR
uniref:PDCD2_C domain-containing protein n=1 Tax=Globodera pallida TaxID=36090 RepID=A0A183BWJ2_GLOPA